jgi:hypothetical protein
MECTGMEIKKKKKTEAKKYIKSINGRDHTLHHFS